MDNTQTYDLVIIGASAAGLSASIYAARRNLNFVVISKDIGGEVALSGETNNWPGIQNIQGYELAQNFADHAKSYNVKIEEGWAVTAMKKEGNYHLITTKNTLNEEKIIQAKAIIVASGIHPRILGLPGEKEFRGKGVTYCTVCDGPLFRGKITATIGAGNSALESILMMTEIASKAYLITKYPNDKENNWGFPKGENILIDKVKKLPNVEIIYNAVTKEIVGDKLVTGLKYIDTPTNEEKLIELQGVLIHAGMVPNSDFVTCGEKTRIGEIVVDLKCQTSCPGVFAAGDVTNIPFKQITIAAGHGVTAALAAIEYLNKWSE
jgi:alkyl hydroperoxide reductase subunit F